MKIQGIILMGFLFWAQNASSQSPIRKLTQRNVYLNTAETNTISQCEALNPDISIRNIFIDQNNMKYLATKNRGVFKLKDCTSDLQNILKSSQSYFIDRDLKGNIWVATSGNQLVNLVEERFVELPVDKGEAYINFIHFSENYIWVGTLSQGLILLDVNGEKLPENDSLALLIQNQLNAQSNEVYDLYVDKFDHTWLATENGLFKINKAQSSGSFINSLQSKVVKSVTGDQECIWFSTLGELWKLNLEDEKLIQIDVDKQIGVIEDLVFDHNHQLWIAGDVVAHYQSKGNITTTNARVYDSNKGFESRKAVCLAVDRNNIIWVGTSGSGVYKVQNDSHRMVSINYVQTFQKTDEALVAVEQAEKVNVLQIGYTINNKLDPTDFSDLEFELLTPSGQKIQLSDIGIPEYYENLASTRNFKTTGIDQLSSGSYTLRVLLNNQEVGVISFELN